MKRKNLTRNALFTSILSLLLCVSMLVGTTFAWFTDEVTSGQNVIASGNLDIQLEYWNGSAWVSVNAASDILTNSLWEPGVTEIAYLRVTNAGSLALKYQLGINIASETPGINVAGSNFKLSDYIQFGVVENVNGETGAYASREAAVAALTSAAALNAGYSKAGSLTAGAAPVYLALVVFMPTSVDNVANHKTGTTPPQINLGINVFATQLEAELDSFGSDYDADAGYDSGKSNIGPYSLNVLSNGSAVYDDETSTYTITVKSVGEGGYNASQGGRYFAGYTVNVAGYGENASVNFTKDDGTEVSWPLADEERDGFITDGVHQQWTSLGTKRAYHYDIDGDGVTDFTVVNDVSNAALEVTTADKLEEQLAAGTNVTLGSDITLDVADTAFTVPNGVTSKLDLNGHNITATSTSAQGVQLFSVSGNLEIVGNGTISLKNDNYEWTTSYRYTTINIRETGVVTLGNGVKVVCEAGSATEGGYGMAYAVDIYTTGTLNVNGASLHSNYIAVRCFFGDSVVNVNSGSITSSRKNYGIWPQSAPGAKITVADGIAYTVDADNGIYIFG